jgi:acetylornithine deacetylase
MDEPVGEGRRDRVEDRQRARGRIRVHLGPRPANTPHDRARDIVDALLRAEPADVVAEVAHHRVAEFGRRRDRVDARHVNLRAREFRSQRLGQSGLRRFRRGVAPHEPDPAPADDRRHEDQVAAVLRAEDRQRRARPMERPHVVDVHHPGHHVGRRVFERAVVPEPRVADHDVEAAEFARRRRDQRLNVRLPGHIRLDDGHAPAGLSNLPGSGFQPRQPARAEDDRRAFPRETGRAGEPDAGRGAGDGRDAPFEKHPLDDTMGPGCAVRRATFMDPSISLLRDLVAIDSVNPSLVPGAAGEGEIAEAIAAHLRRLGLDVEMQPVVPGRSNVIGVLEGRATGRSLMLCGHIDTVGVDGMKDPFNPVERDGRLYGRGAQDMKGGVAAMIDAARVAAHDGFPAGRLIIAAVVDEEYASLGADALVTRWRADGAVVTEPTDLRIAIGHKGFAWFEIQTTGRAAHGSRPREGRDAILQMGRVLHELERLDRRLQAATPHPLLGTASLHASLIEGGRELSSYPDRCSLQLERRTVSGETVATVTGELDAILAKLRREDPEFDATLTPLLARPPYALAPDHDLPRALAKARHATGGDQPFVGMSFWTDAAVLGSAGIPSVLFGPGGAGLHSVEEYVDVDDVLQCRDTLAALARGWCGGQ